jgi:hypothetical protein
MNDGVHPDAVIDSPTDTFVGDAVVKSILVLFRKGVESQAAVALTLAGIPVEALNLEGWRRLL